jgi:hypothetical protein
MSVGQMTVGQKSVCQMYVGQMSVGQMSVGQMSVGLMSVGQMSVSQMSVGQMFFYQKTQHFVDNGLIHVPVNGNCILKLTLMNVLKIAQDFFSANILVTLFYRVLCALFSKKMMLKYCLRTILERYLRKGLRLIG